MMTARVPAQSARRQCQPAGVRFLAAAAGLLLAACAPAPLGAPVRPADPAQSLLFVDGVVLTMEAGAPTAQALAVRGERIEAVGSDAEILALREPGSIVVDLDGRALMPGFVDAHTHILNDARSQGMSLDQAQMLALQYGITTLGDLYVDEAFLREIRAFDAAGYLRVRASLYLVDNDPCGRPLGDWWKAHPPTRRPGERLRIGGVKLFTDGGSCGAVALSFEWAPGTGQGDLWMTQAALDRRVAEAQALGFQVAIHAIGDRAVGQAQAAIARALAGGPNTYRHRLEHVSVLQPEQIARFGQLGILPVIPGQYPHCRPFGPPAPEGHRDQEWPWRELRAANPGLAIGWHSDYPFHPVNPFIHLYGFVTRRDVYQHYTCQPRPWLADDTLPVEEALSIMTVQSAYVLFREGEVGTLAPGKYADLVVVDRSPLAVPAEELRRLNVMATLVGGRFEYCNPWHTGLCPGYQARRPAPLPDYRPPVPVRWLAGGLLVGVPLSAAVLSRRRRRAAPWLVRLGGLLGAAGGAAWALGWELANAGADGERWLALPIAAAAAVAVGTAALNARERPGRLEGLGLLGAFLGAIMTGLALLLSEWFQIGGAWALLVLGVLSHGLGLTLFGLAGLRRRGPGLFSLLPLAIGLLGGPVPVAASIASLWGTEWPGHLMALAVGLGWIALGGLLAWTGRTND